MTMRRLLLAATALAAVSSPAWAVLQVSVQSGGSNSTCVDNNAACDIDPALNNILVLNTVVNGISVVGNFSASTVAPDSLTFSNLTITNTNSVAQTVELAAGATGFGPATELGLSGSGTFENNIGGSGTLNFFQDPANVQGAGNPIVTPGGLLFTASDSPLVTPDSFSGTSASAISGASPYSMTLDAVFTLEPGASVTGFNMAAQAIPEPSTWVMLVAGFGLLGTVGFRKGRASRFAV